MDTLGKVFGNRSDRGIKVRVIGDVIPLKRVLYENRTVEDLT